MTDKVYIVVNEQQEREVLEKLEQEGLVWIDGGEKPTEWIPSKNAATIGVEFPYALLNDDETSWKSLFQLDGEEIVYDGRKEEHMSDKYVVSQEFMNELEDWKETLNSNDYGYKIFVSSLDIYNLPVIVSDWWANVEVPEKENNNRLIAIVRWVNGEDVFEVEKSKKWVVRSKKADNKGNYMYGYIVPNEKLKYMEMAYGKYPSAYFDTKEEAQSWANSHQEVVEVEE